MPPNRTLLAAFLLAAPTTACARVDDPGAELVYVGSEACGECHREAMELVAGTAHPLAMQEAAETSILGDFGAAQVSHFGVTSEFLRRSGRWLVRTDGADGAVQEYDVVHAVGVYPLQQYLVRFPGGRYQVLPLAWDARPSMEGGQRWFHVYPDEAIRHTDELHWTGPHQTWNYMCAECHVTGLKRGYDAGADGYRTTWNELGVGCEGCHGPGSRHVLWARARERDPPAATAAYGPGTGLLVDLGTAGGAWGFDGGAIARRAEPLGWNAQVETCGVCHGRRETLVREYVPGRPLLATHRPELLDEGLYYADGQVLDEVYEYGSFLQSRMYRAGVTCSDCHHPSTQEVPPGNLACAKCHLPETFDTPAHTFHERGSTGASCVACHMPPRTYMVVDPRHDHSIRTPRPDLSVRIGTPNACTTCHTDRSDAWAARVVEQRYGAPRPERHYGDVIDAARRGLPSADTALVRLATDTAEPGIVRATAVSLLNRTSTPAMAPAIAAAALDSEPLVRLAAAMTSYALTPDDRLRAVASLLQDSLLAIRVEAARALADIPDQRMTAPQRAAARVASDEFMAAQLVNADRPESHLRLGLFHQRQGRPDHAERAYRDAIRVAPHHPGGYLNLADLYRAQGRDAEGEQVLTVGLQNAHQTAALHHALGLLLVRTRRLGPALDALARAVQLDPDVPRFALVYAVALHSLGRTDEAVRTLEDARRRTPGDQDLDHTLARIKASRPSIPPGES